MLGLSLTDNDIAEQISAQLLAAASALQNASDINVVKKALKAIHRFLPT